MDDILISDKTRRSGIISRVYDVLKRKSFKKEVGIVADAMFVGGSVGQNTAVPGHYDLDLVIYSRGIDPDRVVRDGYGEIQDKIERYLEEELSAEYMYRGRTQVAVQFQYRAVEVDLLLSPYWEKRRDYYHAMGQIKEPRDRFKWFSVSVSKFQAEFIQNQPQKRVHELIKRAKAWSKVAWKDDESGGKPKSYLIALLVITAFHRVGRKIQKRKQCKSVVEPVAREMKELVNQIATSQHLDLEIPGTSPEVLESDLLYPFKPRIIDPTNPVNNLYKSGVGPTKDEKKGRWEPFKEKIGTFDISYPAYKRNLLILSSS